MANCRSGVTTGSAVAFLGSGLPDGLEQADIRRRAEQRRRLAERVGDMRGLHMGVERFLARPFLDEGEIGRVGVVLGQLIGDAAGLLAGRIAQDGQDGLEFFDLVGLADETGDDTQGVFSRELYGTPGYFAPETRESYRYSIKVGARLKEGRGALLFVMRECYRYSIKVGEGVYS